MKSVGRDKERGYMRMEQRKLSEKKAFGRFTRAWSFLFLLISLAFGTYTAYSGFVSQRYLLILGALLLLFFLLLFPVLFSYRFKKSRKIFAFVCSLLFSALYITASVYLAYTAGFLGTVSRPGTKSTPSDKVAAAAIVKEPFHVLISGIDSYGDIGDGRSDVNMVASVNPKTKTILLTTIPRDYYIELPHQQGTFDKLTHTGLAGPEETKKAVENLLDLKIDYRLRVNYSTLVNLVDAMGGITVHSDYDFVTLGDEYIFQEGDNEMDGENALAFVRERSAFTDGDLQRNRDQAYVLQAIIDKLTKSPTLLLKYTAILDSLDGTMEMDFTPDQVKALVRMQMDNMDPWTICRQGLIGENSLEYSAYIGDYASVVLQDEESIEKAKAKIHRLESGEPVEEEE